ncbi:hypothetical protein K0U07_04345, partial [bacterium]|nr:hypothetical protein [bacterium]
LKDASLRKHRLQQRLEEEEQKNTIQTVVLIAAFAFITIAFFSSHLAQVAGIGFIAFYTTKDFLGSHYIIETRRLKVLIRNEAAIIQYGSSLKARIAIEKSYFKELRISPDFSKSFDEFKQAVIQANGNTPLNLPKTTCMVILKKFLYIQYLESLDSQTAIFQDLFIDYYTSATRQERDRNQVLCTYQGIEYTAQDIQL